MPRRQGGARSKTPIAHNDAFTDIGAMDLDLTLTAILGVVCALAAAGCGYMGARAPDPRRGPRMLPWRFMMLVLALVTLLLASHLLNLLGLKHDQPLRF
jgi:hypothetical protein